MEKLGSLPVISYKEFQKNGLVQTGLVITNVPPSKVYTTQSWIDVNKVSGLLSSDEMIIPNNLQGYWCVPIIGKPKLVLGDGNTRALIALQTGKHISITVEGQLPFGTRFFPLLKLWETYADLFQEF